MYDRKKCVMMLQTNSVVFDLFQRSKMIRAFPPSILLNKNKFSARICNIDKIARLNSKLKLQVTSRLSSIGKKANEMKRQTWTREREGGRAVIWQAEFRETQPVLRRLYRLYRLPWDYSCEQTRLGITAACHDLYRSR